MPNRAPTAPYVYTKTRTQLTDKQIAQVAYNAGFRGDALVTAIAIALRESGGNTTALNDRGEFSVGLWQINVNGYLAQRLERWDLDSWQQLWDPQTNANAAFAVSGSGKDKFNAWSAYKHNSYLRHMDRARAAVAAIGEDPGEANDPNASKAAAFLGWWAANYLSRNPLSTWRGVLNEFGATNQEAASYIENVLNELNIPLDEQLNFDTWSNTARVLERLRQVSGVPKDTDPIEDLLGITALTSFFERLVPDIAHGFYFLVFIIIGLVIMVVAFKARKAGAETA